MLENVFSVHNPLLIVVFPVTSIPYILKEQGGADFSEWLCKFLVNKTRESVTCKPDDRKMEGFNRLQYI